MSFIKSQLPLICQRSGKDTPKLGSSRSTGRV